MMKSVFAIFVLVFSTQAFAADACLIKATDAIVDYLEKDIPEADIWKTMNGDELTGLFDANGYLSSFTLTDIVEDEFEQTVIFSSDDSDYIVFASYKIDEKTGECVVVDVDGGQNDQD